MSIEAMTWALNATVGDPTRKLVLIGFANHAHKDGRNAWASKDTIAEYVGCDPKTVRRHVKTLLAEGWIRRGDQAQVAHLRADRRPVVYDLAMNEATREQWSAPADDPTSRGDNLSPREDVTGGHTGGHPGASRGDKAVSPEPSRTKEPPPSPPAARVGCQRPGQRPHTNCRGCGTTSKQIAARQEQAAADARRRREAAERAAERDRAAATAVPSTDPTVQQRLAEARAALAGTGGGQ